MDMNRVTENRLAKITETRQTLRPGQIVQGKILKIYPKNKAQIQLGSQKMIAQLEASLTIGGKYHFQVQPGSDVVHLKVLGEQLKNQTPSNVRNLLHYLGLKSSKWNTVFMHKLIDEKIPFEKNQLSKAFQLMDGVKNKPEAHRVLQEMIVRKLPMTNSVFQALFTKNTSSLSERMGILLQQLKQDTNQTQLKQNLMDRLNQLMERPLNTKSMFIKQIAKEVMNNNQSMFNILKAAGAVDSSIDFSAWKSQWESVTGNNLKSAVISSQQLATNNIPIQMNEATAINALEHMNINKTALLDATRAIIQKWGNIANQAIVNKLPLANEEFTQFKQAITQKVFPLLTQEQHQAFIKILQNNPASLRQLFTTLQTMANEQTYVKMEQFLMTVKQGNTSTLLSPKEQFLTQVRQVLQFTGITHENAVSQDQIEQQSNTIKSMLIQLTQQSDSGVSERSVQLLNFINGLQLQSVNESANFLQASLQIPGEKLGLHGDVELDFEGTKTKSGELNPDYCRILFYLDLANIKETVIDMHIQKRTVAVTVLNDYVNLEARAIALKPVLKEGLAGLDYELSTVTFKPYHKKSEEQQNTALKSYQSTSQGVDYRI